MKTLLLFIITALAELVGCYLPYAWLRKGGSPWLLLPAAISLASFAWLLTLHPTASGRVYAAYGGVYVAMAVLWLWVVDDQRPTRWDIVGAAVAVIGMAIIMFAPRPASRVSASPSSPAIPAGRAEPHAASPDEVVGGAQGQHANGDPGPSATIPHRGG